jgi:hypothetical protein
MASESTKALIGRMLDRVPLAFTFDLPAPDESTKRFHESQQIKIAKMREDDAKFRGEGK